MDVPYSPSASEDEDHVAFNNDRVKHDMNDDPNENEENSRSDR